MTSLNRSSKPDGSPGRSDTATDGNIQGPMSQQAALGSHGCYDIHPQTFVRLVGCHQPNAAKYEI